MSGRPNINQWARMVLLLGGALLIASVYSNTSAPAGMQLAVDGQGLSFELRTAFINIAFEIGQSRPKTDTLRNMIG